MQRREKLNSRANLTYTHRKKNCRRTTHMRYPQIRGFIRMHKKMQIFFPELFFLYFQFCSFVMFVIGFYYIIETFSTVITIIFFLSVHSLSLSLVLAFCGILCGTIFTKCVRWFVFLYRICMYNWNCTMYVIWLMYNHNEVWVWFLYIFHLVDRNQHNIPIQLCIAAHRRQRCSSSIDGYCNTFFFTFHSINTINPVECA